MTVQNFGVTNHQRCGKFQCSSYTYTETREDVLLIHSQRMSLRLWGRNRGDIVGTEIQYERSEMWVLRLPREIPFIKRESIFRPPASLLTSVTKSQRSEPIFHASLSYHFFAAKYFALQASNIGILALLLARHPTSRLHVSIPCHSAWESNQTAVPEPPSPHFFDHEGRFRDPALLILLHHSCP